MSKVTFDGLNKLITISTGTTSIDVKVDIYQEWKKWVLEGDNSKWLPAFRSFGGDPTTTNQNAPSYYFLINSWRVKAENVEVVISENLYSDDYENPYINIGSTILSKNSDIPNIDNLNDTLTGITEDIKLILGLSQHNYRLSSQVYDSENRLTSSTIKLFNSKSDCDNNINNFAEYQMNATYDTVGQLIDYKVTKI